METIIAFLFGALFSLTSAPGQLGYEGQPGNQGNGQVASVSTGQLGYEGQPGNQGNGQQGYEGQPGNQGHH